MQNLHACRTCFIDKFAVYYSMSIYNQEGEVMFFRRLCFILGLGAMMLLGCSQQQVLRKSVQPAPDGWDAVPEILSHIELPQFQDLNIVISDLGAINDGNTDCRPALQTAIDSLNQKGGGRVIVPQGTWFCKGPIHLKSNIHLYLEKNAVIEFSSDPKDYLPVVLTRWEGTELYNYSPMIYTYMATNVAITGQGTLDGNATESFATWKPNQKPAQLKLRQMGNDGVPVHERVFGEGHWLRPSMVQFYGCKNVLVDSIKILDSPFWVIHPVFCKNVTVRNVEVDSWNANNDGCDPDASVNVLIENCTFNCGDDGVAIKSGRDQDGWRIGQATENVVVRNCTMNSKANGLCIGSEMSGGVRNIFMENCTVGNALSTIYFKSNLDRGGMIENVWVRNITVERARGAFIRFETNYKGHRGNFYPPVFRHFMLENITCQTAENIAIFAEGHEVAPLQDILFRNITVNEAKYDIYLKHAQDITMQNVVIDGERQPLHPPMTEISKEEMDMGW